jgi:OmpA-OmpF porin, OOP family
LTNLNKGKSMHAKTWITTFSLAAALGSANAWAQQADPRGFYVGLSVGQSRVDIDDSEVPAVGGATASSVSKEETDSAFKVYGGYRILPYLAVEGGWADLGKFRAGRNVTAPAVGSLSAEIEASGPYVQAVGILPLQRFELFATGGFMYATTETTLSTSGAVVLAPGIARTEKDSELEFKFGLGASFSFTRNLAIRAEYERFFDVGTSDTGEGDIDLLSVGIVFRF